MHSTCSLVGLVPLVPMEYHSFQWYSIGEMHIITGLIIFPSASGCEGVHSTCPLVRVVPMEYHSFQWYSMGEMHIITGT